MNEPSLAEKVKALRGRSLTETLRYWADVTECTCASVYPTGGCLKCDLDKCLETLKKVRDLQVEMEKCDYHTKSLKEQKRLAYDELIGLVDDWYQPEGQNEPDS